MLASGVHIIHSLMVFTVVGISDVARDRDDGIEVTGALDLLQRPSGGPIREGGVAGGTQCLRMGISVSRKHGTGAGGPHLYPCPPAGTGARIFVPLLKIEDSQDYCPAPKMSPDQAFVLSSVLTFLVSGVIHLGGLEVIDGWVLRPKLRAQEIWYLAINEAPMKVGRMTVIFTQVPGQLPIPRRLKVLSFTCHPEASSLGSSLGGKPEACRLPGSAPAWNQ